MGQPSIAWICCWPPLHCAILHSQADSLCLHVILHEWIAFYSMFLNIQWSGVLTELAWLVPHETAAISVVLCTPYNHAPCHFMQSHISKVHVYLDVTCCLHFRQNDWGLLCAPAVTRGCWLVWLNITFVVVHVIIIINAFLKGKKKIDTCVRLKALYKDHYSNT